MFIFLFYYPEHQLGEHKKEFKEKEDEKLTLK